MDLVEVDPVGLEAAQRVLALLDDVAARLAHVVGAFAHLTVELGREHDVVALAVAGEGVTDRLLALAAPAVDVGGVDEVDAGVEGAGDDRGGVFGVGLAAEHHGAEAEVGDLHAGPAEETVFHGCELLREGMAQLYRKREGIAPASDAAIQEPRPATAKNP